MEVEVLTTSKEINFAPKNVYDEVVQNVRTICTTPKYSAPMDRLFGVDAAMLDRPTPKAMATMQAEIVQAVRKYEPRCKVKKVLFDSDIDGRMNVKVRIEILEE